MPNRSLPIQKMIQFVEPIHQIWLHWGYLEVATIKDLHNSVIKIKHLLNVVEGMLCNVSHAQIGVLPDSSLICIKLSNQSLDHSGFACAISSQDGNSAIQRALQGDVADYILGHARIPADENSTNLDCCAKMTGWQIQVSQKKGYTNQHHAPSNFRTAVSDVWIIAFS